MTWTIFVLTYAGLALGRVPGLRMDRAGIAFVGATLMLVTGVLGSISGRGLTILVITDAQSRSPLVATGRNSQRCGEKFPGRGQFFFR